MTPIPIPMLARPLDVVFGPPDPADVYLPGPRGPAIWLTPGGRRVPVGETILNPGPPGGPEHLPWKRRSS